MLTPFLVGAVLAYALHPAVERLAMRGVPRVIAVVRVEITVIVLLFALIMAITKTTFASDEIPAGLYPVDTLGQILLGDYLVPFEVVSVLLLAVMIGAAYLAKGRRREGEEVAPFEPRDHRR